MGNVVLQLSSSVLKLNKLQSGHPINIMIFYIVVMHKLDFVPPFEMFSYFVLCKCAVSWYQASMPGEEEKVQASKVI